MLSCNLMGIKFSMRIYPSMECKTHPTNHSKHNTRILIMQTWITNHTAPSTTSQLLSMPLSLHPPLTKNYCKDPLHYPLFHVILYSGVTSVTFQLVKFTCVA
uniref:Uncharacterized protein n=1 Tax=Cacopsylla melanoneura TaxID=428564 RepID=A0A8D9B4H0_9HEMI